MAYLLSEQAFSLYHSTQFVHQNLLDDLDGVNCMSIVRPEDIQEGPFILLLDTSLLNVADFSVWVALEAKDRLIIAEEGKGDVQFIVPEGWPAHFVRNTLSNAMTMLSMRLSRRALRSDLHQENAKIAQLTSIAQDLSAETNLDKLLTKILTEGRALACSDAASLFLVDKDEVGNDELVFKLTQNDSISFPFEEKRWPLNSSSIVGFVATTGKVCNIEDVYELDDDCPYVFNRSVDRKMGYRTRSNLTIPMRTHQNGKEVIGVLQFLNRKTAPNIKLRDSETTLKETLPFTQELVELLLALASQAAIAIENANLIAQVERLFEGFVKASVTAIEQRDPTTSGHSFRVANLTTAMALAVPQSGISRFKDVVFDETAIREIRYASLLHDFGKVGVREHVLVKAAKLPDGGLEHIRLRFAVLKERARVRMVEERLAYALDHGREAYFQTAEAFDKRLSSELARFDVYLQQIERANQPTVLPEGSFEHLNHIRTMAPLDLDGWKLPLLDDAEFEALSVKRGSLTIKEREEIESHVRHTFEFLSRIPWTADLQNVPQIAYAHHEKLDGSGYPLGLLREEIPLPSCMMTVADIYDALTASDRPYKPAVPLEKALAILEAEAKRGLLDKDLVNMFIEAEIYSQADEAVGPALSYAGYSDRFIKRNTCDYDIPTNPWDTMN